MGKRKLDIEKQPFSGAWRQKLIRKFGREQAEILMVAANARFEELCAENRGDNKALVKHTHPRIFPVIALYESLQAVLPKEAACELAQAMFLEKVEDYAGKLRLMLKIPGLYRIYPKLFYAGIKMSYPDTAGFSFTLTRDEWRECRFEMNSCPYVAVTEKYNCKEVCSCFCRSDDICYGNLHPALKWSRRRTLVDHDCCDFFLSVTPVKSKKSSYQGEE